MSKNEFNIAVVGATGAVGQQIVRILEEKNFPINELRLLSSKRSAGKKMTFQNKEYTLEEATPASFQGIDIAFFSAGGSVSKALAPEAVKHGAVVVDNTSAYRMDENVPLVVPEVNEEAVKNHQGIVSNPNCSTIQMVVALKPIREKYGLKRVIVSTYQAVSGAGLSAVEEMKSQTQDVLAGKDVQPEILPVGSDKKHYQIAFNAIPQIDKFQENGYTFEEMKMINETKKILGDNQLAVAATCVRLPVETGHSESVYVEVENGSPSVEELKEVIANGAGITLKDNPAEQEYPMAVDCVGLPDVFVGRVRRDLDNEQGYHFWVVSDNLIKGAAYNTIQIAESIIKLGALS
ncbi:aspartate-semialdehyde dehydrogenase [Aliibacillus thermotolerans]|uniref:Aspartate-semialdehyde dehydrogenase n=1 Tax=Aliibacillus thermotolerans TaxID=1834418 RepID=A0ABW0U679_9BACI|nr:aspartate-semialdehyde dehydrogenase [Aliibacillus thermotolerans]MDA3130561.1 aspartate-semialdehyde dehydrogenase [Aliibacillus thermotolerans]